MTAPYRYASGYDNPWQALGGGLHNLAALLLNQRQREEEAKRQAQNRSEDVAYRQANLDLNRRQQDLADETYLREHGGGRGPGPQQFVAAPPVVLPEPEARKPSIADIGREAMRTPTTQAPQGVTPPPIVRLPRPDQLPEPIPAPRGQAVTRLGPDYEVALGGAGYVKRPEILERDKAAEEQRKRDAAASRLTEAGIDPMNAGIMAAGAPYGTGGEEPYKPMTREEQLAFDAERARRIARGTTESAGGKYPPELTAIERALDDARTTMNAFAVQYSKVPEDELKTTETEQLRTRLAQAMGAVDGLNRRRLELLAQYFPKGMERPAVEQGGTQTPPPATVTTPPPAVTPAPAGTPAPTPAPVTPPAAAGPAASAPAAAASPTVTIDPAREAEARARAKELQAQGKTKEEIAQIIQQEFGVK